MPVSKENLIRSFSNWGDEFKIEFDIIVNNELPSQWHNVFHMTKDKNCCGKGINRQFYSSDVTITIDITRKYPLRGYILGSGAPGIPGVMR